MIIEDGGESGRKFKSVRDVGDVVSLECFGRGRWDWAPEEIGESGLGNEEVR
jgi:hypothetical protein